MPTPCFAQTTFDSLLAKPVQARFDGGKLTSDAGLLLVAQLDQRLGLIKRLSACLTDCRDPNKTRISYEEMLRQRIFALVAGYEDGNDHDQLRADPMLKVAVGRRPFSEGDLASQPTLSRFENHITRGELLRLCYALLDDFIAGHVALPPKEIVIDFDATDDPTHGQQELKFYHGHYRCHCYLPLVAFASCDGGPQEPILAVLRPGNAGAARGVASLFERLAAYLRQSFPDARIIFRGDAGMATPEVYETCEALGVEYVIGLARNPCLERLGEPLDRQARRLYEQTGEKVRHFGEFQYAAQTWAHHRRVVAKSEIIPSHERETNRRFVVTNRHDLDPEELYGFYIGRGDIECRIKELKNGCHSGRTSCRGFLANQFRLLLHLVAYRLFVLLRCRLRDPILRVAQVETLRVRLIKVAARVFERARHVLFSLPENHPWIDDWLMAAQAAKGGM